MGNDGGSIPTRRELVKEAAKDLNNTQVKEVQKEQQEHGWVNCALSHRPLAPPIVSDWSGKLFNKDAVLESLIAGSDSKPESEASKKEESEDVRIESLREVVECNEPFSPENAITILPVLPADRLRLKERALKFKEQGLTHSLKKAPGSSKKRKKDKIKSETLVVRAEEENDKLEGPRVGEVKSNMNTTGIKNGGTASLTAKVLAEEHNRNKRRKKENNENIKGLFSSSTQQQGTHSDFMTRGFSIPTGARR